MKPFSGEYQVVKIHQNDFIINLTSLSKKARKLSNAVDGLTVSLPFLSLKLKKLEDNEKKSAREIVIKLADKRVLNASECCDNCIDHAIASLQEIRTLLVDKQVTMMDQTDSALYLVMEYMLEAIRQFITWTERSDLSFNRQQLYFGALERLRAHLYRCLVQVSKIADIEIPKIAENMRYDDSWDDQAYISEATSSPLLPE